MCDLTSELDGRQQPVAWLCPQLKNGFILCWSKPLFHTASSHNTYSHKIHMLHTVIDVESIERGNLTKWSGTWFVKVVHKDIIWRDLRLLLLWSLPMLFIIFSLLWWISIVLTHICKSELENSKKPSLYSPGRLVSICLRGADLNTPNIHPRSDGDQNIKKHEQTTDYLCPGKEKATLEMTYILEKALSRF